MTPSQQNDDAKVIGTMGTTQTRNQACCSRTNDMTRKIDYKISSSSKIVLREEEPGSTVKIWHDKDIADQSRNDLKDY